MKHIIAKEYIDIAIRIRKDYLYHIRNMNIKSEKLSVCKDNLEKLKDDIEKNKNQDDVDTDMFMKEKMIDFDKYIMDIQNEIAPIYNKIQELNKEADRLYEALVDKYIGITPEEIREQIVPNLEE